jgi:hypothetical protein
MFERTRQRIENAWIFALAAATAPLTFLASGPCGLACGGCPLGGACLLTSPAVFGLVLVIKAQRKTIGFLGKIWHGSKERPIDVHSTPEDRITVLQIQDINRD